MQRARRSTSVLTAVLVSCVATTAAFGAVVPNESAITAKKYIDAGLDVRSQLVVANEAQAGALAALGVPQGNAFVDLTTGRFATLVPTHPLIPGDGYENSLTWGDLRRSTPADNTELAAATESAFRDYVAQFSNELGLSLDEFASKLNVTVLDNSIVIHVPRQIDGVPVRKSFVTATVNHGNLILMGAARWADMNVSATPTLAEAAARQTLANRLSDLPISGSWGDTELVIVPFEAFGALGYRLAYAFKPQFQNDMGHWEGLVDAHNGELLSFTDTNHYATRHVVGGVYPESNDGQGPEGQEQAGWPMAFADLANGAAFTDTGGNFPGEGVANVTTNLDGEFIRIDDGCGNISESSSGDDDINLGTSGGDDCTTPGGGSNGNTHSSRTSFYHLNRTVEWARGRVDFGWLDNTLEANVNINSSCNAFWSGSTINFYRSGGGCGNTGEIAGVINHEWGHGIDDNDNNPSISFPGEGIADIYAALPADVSCIGRGFFESGNCNGYGDPCTDCSGIRDIDWMKRQSQTPHDAQWGEDNCGGCGLFATVHCLGAVYAEAVWDLAKRDLPNEFSADSNRALEIASKLTLEGASNVGDWFTCNGNNEDGCAGESGYQNFLAADDTDGNLNNGTPHMTAIFNAFNRHGIACSTPTVQNAGCENIANSAPVVTAAAGDSEVTLSWPAVAGAQGYRVYRTEGLKNCDNGKALVGGTFGTSFTDDGLLNGFEYSYSVAPITDSLSCIGPMSSCTSVTPN